MEKTGTDLQSDRKYKQYKSELLKEMKQILICPEPDTTPDNTYNQNPCSPQGNTFYLESYKVYSGLNDKGEQHYGMPCTLTEKQISHII